MSGEETKTVTKTRAKKSELTKYDYFRVASVSAAVQFVQSDNGPQFSFTDSAAVFPIADQIFQYLVAKSEQDKVKFK
jgi:hypothetical protein